MRSGGNPGVNPMKIIPIAIPMAHRIPMLVSSGILALLVTTPMTRAAVMVKKNAPTIGDIPRK
ncbi:MAG: hypothetical protein DDT24_00530 [Chloroflexi bacterium]|nr:hypothetical protein [Chloroflexota bacterium]